MQSVAGLHSGVNPISGDFSTGASGLLITNGTVGAPVRELTIASTLQRMLLDIVEIGGDVDWLPMRAAGVSLVIHDVTMSGLWDRSANSLLAVCFGCSEDRRPMMVASPIGSLPQPDSVTTCQGAGDQSTRRSPSAHTRPGVPR